ncbi:MAG: penicillin-binding transpeptidase domain-containing protein [Bradymonadaceae bacterium]
MDASPDTDGPFAAPRALLVGLAATATIGLTALAAGARGGPDDSGGSSPQSAVHRAESQAHTAAAVEHTLDKLEDETAETVARAGKPFESLPVSLLPDNWAKVGLDSDKAEIQNGKYVQTLPSGLRVTFTLEPDLQQQIREVYREYDVPHGGLAVVEPSTGRVRAMVSHSQGRPRMPNLARRATAPAASVFKMVTATALLESGGIEPEDETCYRGGSSHLSAEHVKRRPEPPRNCRDLGDALAWSINAIIAKLAYRHLDRAELKRWAERFGFNESIPFDLPLEPSRAEIPADPIERARTAAGFWHTYISPVHAATMAAAIANDGLMMRPTLIEKVQSPEGEVLYDFEPRTLRRVMPAETAKTLADLLSRTTSKGTADSYFEHGRPFPDGVQTAGKTGTLAREDPYLSFTWFVGFGRMKGDSGSKAAAVAGLACNRPQWRIKGPHVASTALRTYFSLLERGPDGALATTE